MAFMQPEDYKGPYLVIDGPCGTDYLPTDVADLSDEALDLWNTRRALIDEALRLPVAIRDYCENTTADSIERADGILSRYSAPGYLDCTPWQPGNADELAESYDVCPKCHEQCWEIGNPCPCPDAE